MQLKKYNLALIILPILIFSLGFMTLLSTFPEKAHSQLLFFFLSTILYVALSLIDYRMLKLIHRPLYFLILGLLAVTVVIGEVRGGSARWFGLGNFIFQPSEFAKVVLVIFLASILSEDIQSFLNLKKLLKLGALVLPLGLLVILQPDLGTGIIILVTFAGVLFYAGVNSIYFVVSFFLLGLLSTPFWNLLKDYQKTRILTFFNPTLDVLGSGYNVIQALIAVGSGQLLGKGFGNGTQARLKFLPAFWTDFVFAAFAEEWGLVGVVVILALISALCLGILYVVQKAEDLFGKLLCMGTFLVIFSQFVINVGMNLGLTPVTGIPLPLVSSGGSSLLTTALLLGIVQSVWVHKTSKM